MRATVVTRSMLAGVLLVSGCETEDPRVAFPAGFEPADEGPGGDPSPRGLGEVCGERTPDCGDGLSCYEGTCTPTPYAEACTPNPCGDSGLCNARGEVNDSGEIAEEGIVLVCRCTLDNEEWDGATCQQSASEDGYPQFSGSILGPDETCPGPKEQLGVPGATDCPAGSFCDAASAGRCLEYNAAFVGMLEGRTIDVSATGREATTVECIREYFAGEEGEAPSGDTDGVKLAISGALAEAISGGSASVTLDLSNNDVLGETTLLVFPQDNAPEPRADAVFATLSIGDTRLASLGGRFTLDSVSGPDEDEDNLIDDGEGAIGGSFFIGLPDEQFLAGAFVVPCGSNESVPLPDEE